MLFLLGLFLSLNAEAIIPPFTEVGLVPVALTGEVSDLYARIDSAAKLNSELGDFLALPEPHRIPLYQVHQADTGALFQFMKELELQIYQEMMERAYVAICARYKVHPTGIETEWNFERLLMHLGVQVIQSSPSVERASVSEEGQDSASSASGQPSLPQPIKVKENRFYVRAFDRDQTVLDQIKTEMVSLETVHGKTRGWQQATRDSSMDLTPSSEGYWPTLSWVDPEESPILPVPLIPANTIKILENKFGGSLGSGIVFGKITSGWVLKYQGESNKHPLFLKENFEPLANDASTETRYFIFAGVGPGSGMIQIISTQLPWSGSIRFPVFEKTATYLDLTRPAVKTVVGKVIDADSPRNANSLPLTTVRVSGQESPTAVPNAEGIFRLYNVLTVAHYPFFLEAEKAGSSTLRYSVFPGKPNSVVLFRVKEKEINSWRTQLNLDREAPLVAGYLRNPIERNEHLDLLPHLQTFPPSPHGDTQLFVRAPNGLLEKGVFLSSHDSRVISANPPNSSFVLGIRDQNGGSPYRGWGFSSNNVVVILGPE